jgi:hypothetical protein
MIVITTSSSIKVNPRSVLWVVFIGFFFYYCGLFMRALGPTIQMKRPGTIHWIAEPPKDYQLVSFQRARTIVGPTAFFSEYQGETRLLAAA